MGTARGVGGGAWSRRSDLNFADVEMPRFCLFKAGRKWIRFFVCTPAIGCLCPFFAPLRVFFVVVVVFACVSVAAGDEAGQGKGAREDAQQKFRIPSSEVYNELMVRCRVVVC